MKKIIFSCILCLGLTFTSKVSSAQNFAIAIQQYVHETGSTLYQGQEVQPEWFKRTRHGIDDNGDGKIDYYVCSNQFWLFGHCFWQSEVWFENENGDIIYR